MQNRYVSHTRMKAIALLVVLAAIDIALTAHAMPGEREKVLSAVRSAFGVPEPVPAPIPRP